MNRTFGAPEVARTGSGHAGLDTSRVFPITPGNGAPAGYSTIVDDAVALPSDSVIYCPFPYFTGFAARRDQTVFVTLNFGVIAFDSGLHCGGHRGIEIVATNLVDQTQFGNE